MEYAYTLVRSDRKTVAVQIGPEGTVTVRAPRRLPQKEIDAFLRRQDGWIQKHLAARAAKPEEPGEEPEELKKKLRETIPRKIGYYASRMGLEPASVRYTSAQKRFGSCNGKNGLNFSYILMKYPDAAVDYVVVHELAHIRHKNHGREFYALIEQILPDYRERRKLLRG